MHNMMTILRYCYGKVFGRHKNFVFGVPLAFFCMFLWCTSSWLAKHSVIELPPPGMSQEINLRHYRYNRNLAYYMGKMRLLIEPSNVPCKRGDTVPLIIMVATKPQHIHLRMAMRETWGKYQPTYFLMGVYGSRYTSQLHDNKVEARQYNDLIVFDFQDHYQNMTIKTALMIHWSMNRCPQAQFMLKTIDGVLVNPWALQTVIKDHSDAKLIGHRYTDTLLHRNEFNKWYIPRWLYTLDIVPQHLSGGGYLIKGQYLQQILKRAYLVPLINLEDIYFTYLVAYKRLVYTLHHDWRITPKRPWINMACAYWNHAITHSYSPSEMMAAWRQIESVVRENATCSKFFNSFMDSEFFLHHHYH